MVFSDEADDDLQKLFDFALQRELDRETGDLESPARDIQAIKNAIALLTTAPFTCRKAGSSSFVRELILPFGQTGYVALFEIVDSATVIIGAIRHQREDDYH